MMLQRKFLLITPVVLLLTLVAPVTLPARQASAVSTAGWQAGRIIDDPVFVDSNSMTVAQIQAFLNNLVPSCDTFGTQPATEYGRSDLTHAQYATQVKGWPGPPYVCLKDYYEVPKAAPGPGMPDNSYNHGGNPPAGSISAAQMIYNAAQQYNISPKVLLVKIRSESAGPLTTDTWPLQNQYTYAMGAHCPDSGPNHSANCDPNYAGFSIQISEAAALLRYYLDNMTQPWWPYKKLGVNNILYNPDPSCGSSNVNIVTSATAALYTYTPYQPNSAALAAGYGTAPCGAYGNRNFWLYFNEWFGYTLASNYSYSFVSSSNPSITLEPGQVVTGNTITVRNNGNSTWYADGNVPVGQHPVRLAIRGYQNTPYADPNDPAWLGTTNQIKMTTATVAPGATATFTFNLKGPLDHVNPFTYLFFVPVVDGVTFMQDVNMGYGITNTVASYTPTANTLSATLAIAPNETKTETITLQNTGSSTWYSDGNAPPGYHPFRLAVQGYQASQFADPNDPAWLGTTNQIKMTTASVAPGATATFTFNLHGPLHQANQQLTFVPVLDGISFGSSAVSSTAVSTPTPDYSYSYVSATNPPSTMRAGTTASVSVTIRNDGNVIWSNEATTGIGTTRLRLMMRRSDYHNSAFYDSTSGSNWLLPNQIQYTGGAVAPGATATFTFTWKAPAQAGSYVDYFSPVLDGYHVLSDIGMGFAVQVTP